jgi:predicted dehydrogenase
MAKMKGVLIGCGAIAREHLTALKGLDIVQVPAICDISPIRAEATAERFGIDKCYTNYRKLLADHRPDLVHITTPPSSHFEIAHECLAMGLNVLCEKPITVDYEQFKILKKVAEAKNCALIENQNLRFHSSIKQMVALRNSDAFGELLDVQIAFSINLVGPGSPYIDQNASHFGVGLRGGVIGDFLPHIAYLTYMFTGPISDLRTVWMKRSEHALLLADEFRGFIKGEHAGAHVSFSANSQIAGYWIKLSGSRMVAEANLLEPPRLALRRLRAGEPALGSFLDGIAEARDILKGTFAAFSRKLGGMSSYDGLPEMIARIYRALERDEPQPVPLDEIDAVAHLVDRFTRPDLKL